jgi:hypothetical protein
MQYVTDIIKRQHQSKNILRFQIEPAGYGATLSRLIAMLNLSLLKENDAIMDFTVQSGYKIKELFDMKHLENTNKKERIIQFGDFLKDVYYTPHRKDIIYPKCPLFEEIDKYQWQSILAYTLFHKPTAILKSHINDQKDYLKWDSYEVHIGLHIRRGDKTIEHPHVPVEVFVGFLKKEIEKYSGKRIGVYLCSDDPVIIDQVHIEGVDILWDDREKRYNNSNLGMVCHNQDLLMQESITAARIISLFGECDSVIGLLNTQFTWLGGLLSMFRKNFDSSGHIMINPRTFERGHTREND